MLIILANWSSAYAETAIVLSLGDLAEGGHGRADVARLAATELDQIGRVAACLHAAFGDVAPAVRLAWAEVLSQFDGPADLRSLSRLPRWSDVNILDRRDLQHKADWLFSRISVDNAAALGLMNDLVRTCLLLASHSPVNQLQAGHVIRDTPVQLNSRISLAADLSRVRIGMEVLLFHQEQVVARGVVEDLVSGVVEARVVSATAARTLPAGTLAQFGATRAVRRAVAIAVSR